MSKLLKYKTAIISGLSFIGIAVFLNLTARFILGSLLKTKCHTFWPMNVFWPTSLSGNSILLAVLCAALFVFCVSYLSRNNYRLPQVIIACIMILLCANLIHGWKAGFADPISAITPGARYGVQYYHDAVKVTGAGEFLSNYNLIQPRLRVHSQTHPPGPVLLIYALNGLFHDPAFISLIIAVFSTILTSVFLYGVLSASFNSGLSGFLVFLFLLIPSMQIYYAASIDALIAAFMLGALYFFLYPRRAASIAGTAIFLFISSFLTFSALFLLPVMFGYELTTRKSVRRSASVLFCVALIYLGLYFVFGFDYIKAFSSAFTNKYAGIFPVSRTILYVITRAQAVWEIILFFGPFLSLMAGAGFLMMKRNGGQLFIITRLALFTMLAVLAVGMFSSGETARICLFIYPYLFFPVAYYLQKSGISQKEGIFLLCLVFGQALLMQASGYYFW